METPEKDIFDIARSGTVAELKDLIEKEPDCVNAVHDMGFSPLILASYRGNKEVALYLIDVVRDVNYLSQQGTALAGLSMKYDAEIAEKLLQNNADPNLADAAGATPLIWAARAGNADMIKLLLKYNAKKDQADANGFTPLQYALHAGNQEVVSLLQA